MGEECNAVLLFHCQLIIVYLYHDQLLSKNVHFRQQGKSSVFVQADCGGTYLTLASTSKLLP